MNNDNSRDSADKIYHESSSRVASQLLAGYKREHPNQLDNCDMLFRLRVAHALLLKFHHFYFNLTHDAPTISSQVWLVRNVLQLISE